MSIKPNKKYHGIVASGSRIIESQNGTMGYNIQINSDDGPADYTVWMTEKNKDRARAAFVDILEVPEDKLQDHNYFEYMLSEEITGRPITFTTTEEEYNGKKRVKVAFIFKPGAWSLADKSPGEAAAQFFGAKVTEPAPIDDDDIKF